MNSKPVTAYIGLGSNLGDRRENLVQALDLLAPGMKILERSSIYDTAPQENPDQPRFLNMVARVATTLEPEQVLALAKSIEAKMGRTTTRPNSPRPIDIDIIFYGNHVCHSPSLVIPHPAIARRAFVLVPLAEIAPRLKHPVTKQTISDMLKEINTDAQGVVKFEEEPRPNV
jgi:2-amino-4-hydroxy-6-hydroxymethyldihydropteridine diphosphokinase